MKEGVFLVNMIILMEYICILVVFFNFIDLFWNYMENYVKEKVIGIFIVFFYKFDVFFFGNMMYLLIIVLLLYSIYLLNYLLM